MDGKDFDALIARLTGGTSRRGAVRGIVGGALTSVGAAALADDASGKGKGKGKGKDKGKGKGKKGRKRATAETNAVGNGKRILCFCPDNNPQNCTTRRLKTKKAKKRLRKFPNSSRGRCEPVVTTTAAPPTTLAPTTAAPTTTTTTSSTTVTPTTTSSTTSTPSSTPEATTSEPTTSGPPTTSEPPPSPTTQIP